MRHAVVVLAALVVWSCFPSVQVQVESRQVKDQKELGQSTISHVRLGSPEKNVDRKLIRQGRPAPGLLTVMTDITASLRMMSRLEA